MPAISAIVCTADRPDMCAEAVRSILANTHPDFELLLVDQSAGDATVRALGDMLHDPRLAYVRCPVRGKGVALNLGLLRATAEIVALTDDDCRTPPDWLERVAAAFESRPNVAVVFGTLAAGPHDSSLGFVPAFRAEKDLLVTSVLDTTWTGARGACMGVRRSAIAAIGGFDPAFGPGGRFRSGDDWDIAIRALLAGFAIYQTPSIDVVHYGFRTFGQGRQHARRDWYAIGAVCAKPLRAGEWRMLPAAIDVLFRLALVPALTQVVRLRRPQGITRFLAFGSGFVRGLRTPLQHGLMLFDAPRP